MTGQDRTGQDRTGQDRTGQSTNLTPLSLLILCKLTFPTVGLKVSYLPNLALKSPTKIFMLYLGILSNTRSNSS
jgi:hypothetical protein